MMKKNSEQYLFIGNGLNRTLEVPSWSALLIEIAEEYGVSYNSGLPMPLEFERMVNEYMNTKSEIIVPGKEIRLLKQKVADSMSRGSLPIDAIHRQIKGLPIKGIITTNYDFLLEQVFENSYTYDGPKLNKYILERTSVLDTIDFFHPHGHIGNPNSICMGFEHYMGIVQNIRGKIRKKKKNGLDDIRIINVLLEKEKPYYIWPEKFYTSNIGFVGFSLDYSETDIWWLLTHRAQLYYQSNYPMREDIVSNKIVYFAVINKNDDDNMIAEMENKIDLLENVHVEVKRYYIGRDLGDFCDYTDAYHKILRDISDGVLE